MAHLQPPNIIETTHISPQKAPFHQPLFLKSTGTADFNDLKADSAKDIRVLHGVMPKLPPPHDSPEGILMRPTSVMQVTIFPGAGICIGNSVTHVVADGVTFTDFMKYWMTLTKSKGKYPAATLLLPSPPDHSCRNIIKDPGEVAKGHFGETLTEASGKDGHKDEVFHLMINVDCRNRLKYAEAEPIPQTYFLNCMAPGIVSVKKRDLLGHKGVLAASDALTARIRDMLSNDLLKTAPSWGQGVRKWAMSRFQTSVAGAPKLRMYDMDFGSGKPCKMDIANIETGGSIALAESRDGSNGNEIGIALEKKTMDAFAMILQEGIKKFKT
ncbi:PREDICTED: coumaroyl-CoA:anthocyanidin 3-O-glucoside-6''-O-coumaroyltransferase 2-like [Camelina sativa]|uniref:Coumaroyl-CoA:anthocyanidin 3-O-glucoside-6''-O-coumaroyltransferase 2-like n=1 Tax=Camelina sativa TaxID=90675 RepID=A0ABM1R5S5_CAMSA|nr:PREDICTED: coumaroyl-CoA:anthocyanidin 3-O-glucoside-6''-O-coumaroyltransferase 2-like [Camelina sativa]